MITTTGLTKNYGKTRAVSELNWMVPRGSIYGLLGNNGAGKSTTLRMLLGMVRPTSGGASVEGLDVRQQTIAIRQRVAYIPEQKSVHGEMKVADFLRFYGSFFPDWSEESAHRQLEAWQVPGGRRMKWLSKGMVAKVLLAAALARRPKLFLLDEPTEGLDPQSAEEVLSQLAGRAAGGDCSIVISSHRLDEIERICDHVAFMEAGRLTLSGELDELRSSCKTIDVEGVLPLETVRRWSEVHSAMTIGNTLRLVTQSEPATVVERLRTFEPRAIAVHDLSLREIYLRFSSHSNEVAS